MSNLSEGSSSSDKNEDSKRRTDSENSGNLSDCETVTEDTKFQDKKPHERYAKHKDGYIAGMLAEVLPDPKDKEPGQEVKPIKHQNIEERRQSLSAVHGDLLNYFKDSDSDERRTTIADPSSRHCLEEASVKQPSKEKQEFKRNRSQSLIERRLSVSWNPTEVREKKVPEVSKNKRQSWVGSYAVGEDYWKPKSGKDRKESVRKQVVFGLDDEQETSWYDMSLRSMSNVVSLDEEEMEDKKDQAKQTWLKSMKQTKKSMTSDGPYLSPSNEYTQEFQERFSNFARGNDFSADGSTMSLPNADKWLEKAGILEYQYVTLIHTGFCFQAVGGGKYTGLRMPEFLTFLHDLANITKLAYEDLVHAMGTCPLRQD